MASLGENILKIGVDKGLSKSIQIFFNRKKINNPSKN
jgi:hypothetical protein